MSQIGLIKAASCKLECGGIKSSGFFVSPNTLLTALHNIKIDTEIQGETYGENSSILTFELLDSDIETDIAILRVANGHDHPNFLHICSLEPSKDITWKSFGYPSTHNGRSIGEVLEGKIRDYSNVPSLLKHDIVLDVNGYNVSTSVYDGFSGSPLIDAYGNVIAILRYSGHNSLDAVSIKKGKAFFDKNRITYKQDYLLDFEEYSCNCFAGFDADPKRMCNNYATKIRSEDQPETIVRELLGKLYYPHQKGTLEDIIAYLKKNPTTNLGLWKGWLELLSYLSMIPSARPDFNSITITLTSEKFKELFETHRDIANSTIEVKLNFFWTQGTGYLHIISDYIHNNLSGGIENNTCYIFNAEEANWGRRAPKANFKRDIIGDISGGDEAGLHIVKEMNFGVLSLNQISQQVLECDRVADARPKIEQLFINALQND